jgi:hypothetical protein
VGEEEGEKVGGGEEGEAAVSVKDAIRRNKLRVSFNRRKFAYYFYNCSSNYRCCMPSVFEL